MNTLRIGFVGLGNMGAPMARNLVAAGFEVLVFNRSCARASALAGEGAVEAQGLGEIAAAADVVLACLPSVAASEEVFLGEGGLVARGRPGQVLVDHSTVDPGTSRRIHTAAAARGIAFLDAPISGGPEGARAASLAIMVGGDPDAFARARPAFDAMGHTVVLLGPSGAGTVAKLANQLLVSVHALASCEALVLAQKAGVDLERLVEVLARSWGASRILERNAPHVRERRFDGTGAPLRNLVKDLALITQLGGELGLSLQATNAAKAVYDDLARRGWGERDLAVAALTVERAG